MLRTPPTEAEASYFGLTVDEASGPETEVFPDNIQATNAFIAMLTQWRIGPTGATGLVYEALPLVFDMTGISADDRRFVFDDLRTMEDAALNFIRSKK